MRGRFERRAMVRGGLAIGLVALAVFVVLPVFADEPVDAVHLHTAPNGATAFTYDGVPPQPVVNGKGCLIKDPAAGSLVGLGSTAGRSRPGFIRGIGLKTGGANGTPCSQVDEDDAGSLELTSVRGPWIRMELDLELKQNAKIHITLSGFGSEVTYTLLTGSSIGTYPTPSTDFPYAATVGSSTNVGSATSVATCANPSDSGPDSGPNDNCRLTVLSPFAFDTVTVTAEVGSVSLEGGADFVGWSGYEQGERDSIFVFATAPVAADDAYEVDENNFSITGSSSTLVAGVPGVPGVLDNDTDFQGDSLNAQLADGPGSGTLNLGDDGGFTYTPEEGFFGIDTFTYKACDSVSGCSAPATVTITVVEVMCTNEPRSDEDGAVFGEFTLLTEGMCKRYSVEADQTSETVTFTPDGEVTAAFRGVLRFPAETVVPTLNSLSLLEYDPDGDGLDFVTMPVCESPVFDGGNVVSATIPGYPNQTWCLVSVTATANGDGDLAPTYIVYGEGDPIFRVK